MNPCDITTRTGHPIEIVDLGCPEITLGPQTLDSRSVVVWRLDEPEIVYNPIDKKGYVKYFGVLDRTTWGYGGEYIWLWDGQPNICPESGLEDCVTDHCSIHMVERDVDITIVTQADAIRAELVKTHGSEKVEVEEAKARKKVRVNHCSRCGTIHRRALATLNGRCYNCRYYSNRIAALTKIRQNLERGLDQDNPFGKV